ncbi:aminotransferase class V-fold PLP-dependent enzyme [Psychromarinibacter sp. C21-152]|uniref:Aminotransferase class V-fold PLP-dependent enzyme n=1 Tax=Psychromarinibacter sediminicola TaxID=3033385 RepID=A0AAE3TB96_9RHOB|nr:aminotransferase class V-fold PLP-dependent enzyme [Psychromarinibacter sediminicola]MDF0603608.1 aminotransferase class V-fold PLP-dependent enzyme [Psychromarinibacter sediminicola]
MTQAAPTRRAGRHLLQIPGPTNLPDRVLRAMDRPVIDHRGPAFRALTERLWPGLRRVFGCSGPVVIFPGSGSGAWEAALVNTMSPGDRMLMCETGHFAVQWARIAERLGLRPELLPGDWRHGADAEAIRARLSAPDGGGFRAVCAVHNETSTGCVSAIPEIRDAMDAAGHSALLMVDTISSLGSMPYDAEAWGVDVTVGGSQKGLMLPPGLSFNAVSAKALEAARHAALPRAYWDWDAVIEANEGGVFPYTPATNLLYGLAEALDMLAEEGLEAVFERHARHGAATRAAVAAWGLETQCADPAQASNSLTAVRMPEGHSADAFRALVLERFDMSLGNGLSKLADRVFRIGHLGDFNDLSLIAALAGVEMGLCEAGVPYGAGGLDAALDSLMRRAPSAPHAAPQTPATTPSMARTGQE